MFLSISEYAEAVSSIFFNFILFRLDVNTSCTVKLQTYATYVRFKKEIILLPSHTVCCAASALL